MNCYYHPDHEVVSSCVNCGRLICSECKVELDGKMYCNPCTEKFVAETTVANRAKGLSWFERHLNWTENLSFISGILLIYLITEKPVLDLITNSVYSVNLNISQESLKGILFSFIFIINLAWLVPVNGWVLKKRKKSLWNLVGYFTIYSFVYSLVFWLT